MHYDSKTNKCFTNHYNCTNSQRVTHKVKYGQWGFFCFLFVCFLETITRYQKREASKKQKKNAFLGHNGSLINVTEYLTTVSATNWATSRSITHQIITS